MPDQIHGPAFQELSDYLWAQYPENGYIQSVLLRFPHLKVFSPSHSIGPSGVIYVGMCQSIKDCFRLLPASGRYILIHRDNDVSLTEDIYAKKPMCVKHIYATNCTVTKPDVTAIPIGLTTITGDNASIEMVGEVKRAATRVYCRMNAASWTPERLAAIARETNNPLVKIDLHQLNPNEFYARIKAHQFTLSLQGLGKDCLRTFEAMTLGSIPIVTDCPEMRHFEDMPMAYYPAGGITRDWLDAQVARCATKSTRRALMDYWRNDIATRKAAVCG